MKNFRHIDNIGKSIFIPGRFYVCRDQIFSFSISPRNTKINNLINSRTQAPTPPSKSRKEKESKQKYISKRGEADIYYCDFKDLGTIICNDWKIFSKYFSTQSWIKSKIEELADCRNLVAHNNYITQHGIDIIKVTFRSILIQMGYMEDNSIKTNPF